MLTPRQKQALDLLFKMPPRDVERRLKLRPGLIYSWLNYVPFRRALEFQRQCEAEAAVRIGTRSLLTAARRLSSAIKQCDDTAALTSAQAILKMSGLLSHACAPSEDNADQELADIITRCMNKPVPEEPERQR